MEVWVLGVGERAVTFVW